MLNADLPVYDPIRSNPSKGSADAILSRAYLYWASNPLTQAQVQEIAASKPTLPQQPGMLPSYKSS